MKIMFEDEIPLAPETRRLLRIAQCGYLLLLVLIPSWILYLEPPKLGSQRLLLVMMWTPLWLPALGMLRGKAYTLAWANFIVMIYFLHALTNLWVGSPVMKAIAAVELLGASLMFYGCTYYARHRGRELGLKIPKLKDDPVRQD